MRKITAELFITLNGVVEAPETWNPPYYDDELNQPAARDDDDQHPEGCGIHDPARR